MANLVTAALVAVSLTACGAAVPAASLGSAGAPGVRAISADSFEANVKFLASDELAGRASGSEGGAKAEQFMADEMAKLGLEPAGEDGTYFQTVPLREATLREAESSLVVHTKRGDITFATTTEALIWPYPRAADVELDAPLVFAGFGIARPDLGYDDLAGVDVRGKIAVVYGGAPHTIDGKPIDPALRAVLSDVRHRATTLKERGAIAVITIYDPARAMRMPFRVFVTKLVGPAMAWAEGGEPRPEPAIPLATIDEASFDRLIGGGAHALWQQLDRGEVAQLALDATASLRIHSTLRDMTARNVLGRLPGSDPALADEVVVYTAHLDHLGVGPAVDGDTIYNGALDNASGCAGILEIARAFRALVTPPRRSILFIAVTGEEKGLQGSDYYARHPTVPIERIVANINLDGVVFLYEPFDMVAMGVEHSTLEHHAREAARAVGLELTPDPDPDQVYFIRSDQYSFVLQGVPAVFPLPGYLDAKGKRWTNRDRLDTWLAKHYHQPSDEWRPEYRAVWVVKQLAFDFLMGLSVANDNERPRWNPGDVFAPAPQG